MNEPAPEVMDPEATPPQHVARRWSSFYAGFFEDLRDNLAVMSPLIAVFAFVVVPGSSALFCAFECGGTVRDVWEAAYVTWQAMTTSGGFGDLAPATLPGRILVSIDALLGYSLLGVIVSSSRGRRKKRASSTTSDRARIGASSTLDSDVPCQATSH